MIVNKRLAVATLAEFAPFLDYLAMIGPCPGTARRGNHPGFHSLNARKEIFQLAAKTSKVMYEYCL